MINSLLVVVYHRFLQLFFKRKFNYLPLFIILGSFVFNINHAHARDIIKNSNINHSSRITAVVVNEFPPYYQIKNGEPAGFAIDIFNEMAKISGLEVTYVVKDNWSETLKALRDGEADIIPNLGITEKRQVDFDFGYPYETSDISIITRSESRSIPSIDDLEGKLVGVVKTNAGRNLGRDISGISIVVYPQAENALFGLLSGNVDALLYPKSIILSIARKSGLENRIQIEGKPLREIKRSIAVQKGNIALQRRFNVAINKVRASDKYKDIYVKWFGKSQPFFTVKTLSIIFGIVIISILLLAGIWRYRSISNINERLKRTITASNIMERKVSRQTKDLLLSNKELKFQKYALDQHSILVTTDLSGKITNVNDKFTEISGYTYRELVGKTHSIVNSGHHPKGFFIEMWNTIKAGKVWKGQICNRNKKGQIYWVETTIVPHLDEKGKPNSFIAVRTDITALKLLEEEAAKELELVGASN